MDRRQFDLTLLANATSAMHGAEPQLSSLQRQVSNACGSALCRWRVTGDGWLTASLPRGD